MSQDCTYDFQDFESSSFLDHLLVDHYSPYTYNSFNNDSLLQINPTTQEINSTNCEPCATRPPNINLLKEKSKVGIIKKEMIEMNERHVVAFRTKTQLEILDDGYKWRNMARRR